MVPPEMPAASVSVPAGTSNVVKVYAAEAGVAAVAMSANAPTPMAANARHPQAKEGMRYNILSVEGVRHRHTRLHQRGYEIGTIIPPRSPQHNSARQRIRDQFTAIFRLSSRHQD